MGRVKLRIEEVITVSDDVFGAKILGLTVLGFSDSPDNPFIHKHCVNHQTLCVSPYTCFRLGRSPGVEIGLAIPADATPCVNSFLHTTLFLATCVQASANKLKQECKMKNQVTLLILYCAKHNPLLDFPFCIVLSFLPSPIDQEMDRQCRTIFRL